MSLWNIEFKRQYGRWPTTRDYERHVALMRDVADTAAARVAALLVSRSLDAGVQRDQDAWAAFSSRFNPYE